MVAGRTQRVLALARPDVDLDDALRQAVAAPTERAAKPQGQGAKGTARGAESLLTQMSQGNPQRPGCCPSPRCNPPT